MLKEELMNSKKVRNLVFAGLFLALGLVLPYLTANVPALGQRFLPMHIPALLCGFVCGWPLGLVVGFVMPLFRSLMTGGFPPMFPTALAMSFELAVYGMMTGLFYQLLPKKIPFVYVTLILAMIIGRIVWGIATLILLGISGSAFTWQAFIAGSLLNAIPGIIVQIILIPPLVYALQKARLMKHQPA